MKMCKVVSKSVLLLLLMAGVAACSSGKDESQVVEPVNPVAEKFGEIKGANPFLGKWKLVKRVPQDVRRDTVYCEDENITFEFYASGAGQFL